MTALARPGGTDCVLRLRRDGQLPLRFAGRLLAHHDGRTGLATLWHDLTLYGASAGGYAVAIVAHRAGAADPVAHCHAHLCATLHDAASLLERYDASADLCPGVAGPMLLLDAAIAPAALALRAAELHALRHDVVRRYQVGVGAFLARLATLAT